MKKILLFCLCLTPAIVSAAAANSLIQRTADNLFYYGAKALNAGDIEVAKKLLQQSANLGHSKAIEILDELYHKSFGQQNQQPQSPCKVVIKRV